MDLGIPPLKIKNPPESNPQEIQILGSRLDRLRAAAASCSRSAAERAGQRAGHGHLHHWLPDGGRTNGIFAEGPQILYILLDFVTFCHIFQCELIMGNCGTSVMTPFVLTPSGSCQIITGVCEKTHLRRKDNLRMVSFQSTSSRAGEQFLLLDCMAKACIKQSCCFSSTDTSSSIV